MLAKNNVDILVTTPGRLVDHINQSGLGQALVPATCFMAPIAAFMVLYSFRGLLFDACAVVGGR